MPSIRTRGCDRARTRALAVLALLLAACASTDGRSPKAELVLTGGRIVTLDPARPEAEALAAADGRILALGSAEEVAALVGPNTRVIELDGALAVPGFVEGHGHFLGLGDMRMQLDLSRTRSFDEVVALVADAVRAAKPGELVRGRGWHQSKWERAPEPAVQGLPVHDALSAVSPENPVVLVHASGHASLANARAMELAGVDRDTPDPPGGEIVRDAAGEPIGVFRETAKELLAPVLSGASGDGASRRALRRRAALLARDECLAKGVTSFQDAGSSFEDVALLRELAEEGELGLRLWVMLREPNERLEAGLAGYPLLGLGSGHLSVGGIKVSVDGALGSHGAWLLEPYADLPSSTGLETVPIASLERTAELALEHGMQLCVHAIGDRANREVLDVYERAFAGRGPADRRWRIEHAQHLHPDDVPRFAELGVIASMQAVHCTSDAAFVVERLGERRARAGAYVWRALLDSGAVVTNGTDTPVEDVDPIACFHAAVTRRTPSGELFFPDQRMTRMEALRVYTLDAAYAAFEEGEKGSLVPGKLADVTVLSHDILRVPENEIRGTRVLYTIVGGRVLYAADEYSTGLAAFDDRGTPNRFECHAIAALSRRLGERSRADVRQVDRNERREKLTCPRSTRAPAVSSTGRVKRFARITSRDQGQGRAEEQPTGAGSNFGRSLLIGRQSLQRLNAQLPAQLVSCSDGLGSRPVIRTPRDPPATCHGWRRWPRPPAPPHQGAATAQTARHHRR